MHRLLLPLLLLISLGAQASPAERLHYRLSYSGFITGYIWKDLADVAISLTPEETEFRGEPAMRLTMDVNTANYSVAETFHALRYHWVSLLDPSLQRTHLVRVIDEGDSHSHDVYWYDWEVKEIAYFRKREKKDVSNFFLDEAPIYEWETNKHPAPPPFIDNNPKVAPKLSYLLLSSRKKGRLKEDAIDPLAMLAHLRHHDYDTQPALVLPIVMNRDFAPYRIQLVGSELLKFDGEKVPALKLEIKRGNGDGEEGTMHVWYSDDERRLPLRIDVEAPVGTMHIELQRVEETAVLPL